MVRLTPSQTSNCRRPHERPATRHRRGRILRERCPHGESRGPYAGDRPTRQFQSARASVIDPSAATSFRAVGPGRDDLGRKSRRAAAASYERQILIEFRLQTVISSGRIRAPASPGQRKIPRLAHWTGHVGASIIHRPELRSGITSSLHRRAAVCGVECSEWLFLFMKR